MTYSISLMSDEELVSLINEKDIFSELSSRYLTFLGNLVRKISPQESEFDDMSQAALLGLYEAAKSYDTEKGASFKTYATVCISNKLKNEVRNKNSGKNIPLNQSVSLEDLKSEFINFDTPESIIETKENFEAVLNQIHISLSDFERKVLVLVLSGYKRVEGAKKLGITQKAFDNALQRIRRKLKANSSIR